MKFLPPLAFRILVFGAVPALSACVVGPDYQRPALPAGAGYGTAATAQKAVGTGQLDAASPQLALGMDVPAQWWEVFHCIPLDNLVAQALKDNPSIEAANAALQQAQEQVKAQRAAYFPSLSASLSPSRQSIPQTLASPAASGNDLYNLTTTQLSISYAPDLFGANARAVESLVAQEDQQRFSLEAARLTLASNVVLAAIQDASLRAQIDATRTIVEDQRKTLTIFQQQVILGYTSKADLAAQTALLAQTEATLPPLEKQFEVNRDLLAALVGHTPGEALTVQFTFDALTLPANLPLSLPAQLVEHRPDVRMVEAQLHAASAQVGVSIAARLPNVTIQGNAGSAAFGLTPTFNSMTDFWSVAATLTQPLFDAGQLLHRQRAAEAAYEQAVAQYRATVVGAFQNTADTLHALAEDDSVLRANEVSASASRNSLDIAGKQHVLGDISQMNVLIAEQAEAQARLALLQARAARYSDVVALFQSLGGGWWNREPETGLSNSEESRP